MSRDPHPGIPKLECCLCTVFLIWNSLFCFRSFLLVSNRLQPPQSHHITVSFSRSTAISFRRFLHSSCPHPAPILPPSYPHTALLLSSQGKRPCGLRRLGDSQRPRRGEESPPRQRITHRGRMAKPPSSVALARAHPEPVGDPADGRGGGD